MINRGFKLRKSHWKWYISELELSNYKAQLRLTCFALDQYRYKWKLFVFTPDCSSWKETKSFSRFREVTDYLQGIDAI